MVKTSALFLLLSLFLPTAAGSELSPVRVVDLGPHHRTLETVGIDPAGLPYTNRVVQLASGLNWMNPLTGE